MHLLFLKQKYYNIETPVKGLAHFTSIPSVKEMPVTAVPAVYYESAGAAC
jgi:hypothetical protein